MAVLALLSVLLASCSTTVTGSAQPGPPGPTVSLMDTGAYPITFAPPFGAVGDERSAQAVFEAIRLGEFVTGPWQVDADIAGFGYWTFEALVTGPQSSTAMLENVLPNPLPSVAAAHGFTIGFSSQRFSATGGRGFRNVVLMFPDEAAAQAAAAEMAGKNPPPIGAPPGQKIAMPASAAANAFRYESADRIEVVSFTPQQRYVLIQAAFRDTDDTTAGTPESLVNYGLTIQMRRIDDFVPTPADALPDLPKDPTGRLLAQTLWAPDDGRQPFISGVWPASGWLHFEYDPARAAAWLRDAGVDYVSQRLSTVYRAADPDAATTLFNQFADSIAGLPNAQPVARAVPGFPAARCFSRPPSPDLVDGASMTFIRVEWSFKCIAHTDRYVFSTYSETQQDAMRQISAQYRILAGE